MKRKYAMPIIILLMFILLFQIMRSRNKQFEHYITPNIGMHINPKKEYSLQLWDYHLPDSEKFGRSRRKALEEFKAEYPKVHVEVKLLEAFDGEVLFQNALQEKNVPDIYCSYGQFPKFHYSLQIPIGRYLSKAERNAYDHRLLQLYSVSGMICSLPYFEEYETWLVNVDILEKLGIDWREIQKSGWSWENVLSLEDLLSKGQTVFAETNKIYEFTQGNSLLLPDVRYGIKNYLTNRVKFRLAELPPPNAVVDGKSQVRYFRPRVVNVYRRPNSDDAQIALAVKLAKLVSRSLDSEKIRYPANIIVKIKKNTRKLN